MERTVTQSKTNQSPITGSSGPLGRLLIACMQRIEVNTATDGNPTTYAIPLDLKRPHRDYFKNLNEGDSFPDPNDIDIKNLSGDDSERE